MNNWISVSLLVFVTVLAFALLVSIITSMIVSRLGAKPKDEEEIIPCPPNVHGRFSDEFGYTFCPMCGMRFQKGV